MKKILALLGIGLSIIWTAAAQTPNPTINGTPGPFTFTGSGVSQSGQTFTFSSSGGGDVITSPNSTLTVGGTSGATTLDVLGSAGEILAGATPALTPTPTLGKSGTAGTISLFPASGNFTTTLGSAATASNTVDFFASVPTNLDLFYCAVSTTTCTLTDAGYAYNSIPNADLAHSAITIAGTSVSLGGSTSSLPSPGAIGGTTPAAITGTTITANTSLVINGGTAQTGTQGTDTKLLTAGTISGTSVLLCTDASGGATTSSCPSAGTGTVTVVAAGSLTSTAFVTGGGTTTVQTPSATSTLDSSGDASFAGTLAATGHVTFEGVTSTGATGTGKLVFSVSPALTGTPDASGATQFKLPVGASFATAANGEQGYDTTNLNWHVWQNAADNFMAVFPVASPPTSGHVAGFLKSTNSWSLEDLGALPTGTVTSVATAGPITGGTFTTSGTIACASCVVASSPGAGIAHFAGSTQTVTSSAVALGSDVSGQLPIGAVGSAGLSGSGGVSIASTGAISLSAIPIASLATVAANTVLANVTGSTAAPTAASIPAGVQFYTSGTGYSAATSANLLGVCTTCVTSASSLTSNALMTGAGSQGSQTVTTGTGVVTALGVNTGSTGGISTIVCTGQIALSTGAISSGARATNTLTCTGLSASTSSISCTFSGDTNAVTGYAPSATGAILSLKTYATANTINVDQMNNTANSITPGAASVNCKGWQ
jgi:fibronectin-binding autotransporter adhesin